MKTNIKQATSTICLSIAGNASLAIIKGVAGIWGNSYALVADAIESSADVFSSLLVLLGLKISVKPPDARHPYGHGKIEPLMTFAVVVFLLISAGIIGYESILNIQTPHKVPEKYTLFVLGFIILVKEVFYRIIKSRSDKSKSTSLKADAWHHRSDAITSLSAFIGIAIAIYMGKGYENADDWAALLASGIIIYNAFLILRPALGEILDEHLYEDMINDIRKISTEVHGVIDTEKCFIRKAGFAYHVDLHLIVDGNKTVREGHGIAHRLKNKLIKEIPEITDVLIHVEPQSSRQEDVI